MNKKKILMVHNFYQIGGGEHTVYSNEVSMLRDYGHEVVEYNRHNNELKSSRFRLLFLPITMIWSWRTYFDIRRMIITNNIDIVHCHNTFPLISPSVYYAAISLGVPVVQTIHNFRFLCPAGVFYREGKICEECKVQKSFIPSLRYKCYRNSRFQTLAVAAMLTVHRKLGTFKKPAYIFLTEFNKKKFENLIDIGRANIFVKPNFVTYTTNTMLARVKSKYFVFASRLDENKGVKFLLEEWQKMPKDYRLIIFGEGNLTKLVEKVASQNDNIEYYGFQSHDVIFKHLKEATAMIFPTQLYEGFPMIIAESMAIACPVVSTDIGNAGDIVSSSKGGLTFDINDVKSFRTAIDNLIADNATYRRNALNYYRQVLSREKNYNYQIKIYEKISN